MKELRMSVTNFIAASFLLTAYDTLKKILIFHKYDFERIP